MSVIPGMMSRDTLDTFGVRGVCTCKCVCESATGWAFTSSHVYRTGRSQWCEAPQPCVTRSSCWRLQTQIKTWGPTHWCPWCQRPEDEALFPQLVFRKAPNSPPTEQTPGTCSCGCDVPHCPSCWTFQHLRHLNISSQLDKNTKMKETTRKQEMKNIWSDYWWGWALVPVRKSDCRYEWSARLRSLRWFCL